MDYILPSARADPAAPINVESTADSQSLFVFLRVVPQLRSHVLLIFFSGEYPLLLFPLAQFVIGIPE